ELLPGWNLYAGTRALSIVAYNNPGDLGADPSIITREAQSGAGFPNSLSGNYGLFVASGRLQSPFNLLQDGEVPADARFLTVQGGSLGENPVELTVNGNSLPYSHAIRGLGWDVSLFAGQSVELRFVFPQP